MLLSELLCWLNHSILFDLTPCPVEQVGFARYCLAKKLEVKLGSVYLARRSAVGSIPSETKYAHTNIVLLEAWA